MMLMHMQKVALPKCDVNAYAKKLHYEISWAVQYLLTNLSKLAVVVKPLLGKARIFPRLRLGKKFARTRMFYLWQIWVNGDPSISSITIISKAACSFAHD